MSLRTPLHHRLKLDWHPSPDEQKALEDIPALWPSGHKVNGITKPSGMPTGCALFPSWNPKKKQVSIWMVRITPRGHKQTGLRSGMRAAWEVSCAVASWATPFLSEASILDGVGMEIQWLDGVCFEKGEPAPGLQVELENGEMVEGCSAGLAMTLALISHATDEPVPSEYICTGAVDGAGKVGRVGAVAEKHAACALVLPGASALLLSAHDAESIVGSNPRPISVDSVRDALHEVGLDRALREGFVEREPEAVAEVVRKAALAPRAGLFEWRAIANMAEELLQRGDTRLSDREQAWTRLARAIALRHDGEQEDPAIDPEWFGRLPVHDRLTVLAQCCQQEADTAQAVPLCMKEELKDVVNRIDSGIPPSPLELRVWGAYARSRSATAQRQAMEEALHFQRRAVEEWLLALLPAEASYPLCEAFRISGALELDLGPVMELWSDFRGHPGALHPGNESFVKLSIARASVLAPGGLSPSAAVEELLAIADGRVPPALDHVRASAWRWLAREEPRYQGCAADFAEKLRQRAEGGSLASEFESWVRFDQFSREGHKQKAIESISSGCSWIKNRPELIREPHGWLARTHPYL